MTVSQLRIVKYFFAARDDRIDDVVALTFRYTFEHAPETRALFKGELEAHRMLFAQMFRKIIEFTRASHLWPACAQTGNVLLPGLACLRARHAIAGVEHHHFGVMKLAMLKALETAFGADFTLEVRDAFVFVFETLSGSLTQVRDADDEHEPLKKFALRKHEADFRVDGFSLFLLAPPPDELPAIRRNTPTAPTPDVDDTGGGTAA